MNMKLTIVYFPVNMIDNLDSFYVNIKANGDLLDVLAWT